MKVIIAGDREIEDYELVVKAIAASTFKITEVVSGAARGVDSLGEKWAEENGVPVKQFPALWNSIKAPDAKIKTNVWGKKYDANAGFRRNEQMAQYADACIAVQMEGKDTSGTQDMIKRAEANNLKVFVYKEPKPESDYVYAF